MFGAANYGSVHSVQTRVAAKTLSRTAPLHGLEQARGGQVMQKANVGLGVAAVLRPLRPIRQGEDAA